MKKSVLFAAVIAALCAVSCESEIIFNDPLEYQAGIWTGNIQTSDPFADCYAYFDSIFRSWDEYDDYKVDATGKTQEEWYENGDRNANKYIAIARMKADINMNALTSAINTKDLGAGSYGRSGMYFFFSRNMRNSSEEYLAKVDYPEISYIGGHRKTTDAAALSALAPASNDDTVTVKYFPGLDNGASVSFNHFKLCTPDKSYYSGDPIITDVKVVLNSDTLIKIAYNCTGSTVDNLTYTYGTDWYLLTFMDLNMPEDTISNYFAAYTPIRLENNPK